MELSLNVQSSFCWES